MYEDKLIDVWMIPFTEDDIKRMPNVHKVVEKKFKGNLKKALDPDYVVRTMDENGVERAILGPLDEKTITFSTNEIAAKWVDRFPDKFVGIASVNPEKGMDAVREFERVVKDHGFKGLRLVPYAYGRPPNDKLYYALYAKCVELDVPVQYQVGQTAPLLTSEPGRPIYTEEVALDFPELTIIASHIGHPWVGEMIMVARLPNVYIDTSMYAPRYYPPELTHFINTYGQDKVMFGGTGLLLPYERLRQELKTHNFRDDPRRKFFRENAIKVFKL